VGLTKPLFRGSFGRYVADAAARIEGGSGIVYKDLIQGMAAAAK
jgi:hypothetical protein